MRGDLEPISSIHDERSSNAGWRVRGPMTSQRDTFYTELYAPLFALRFSWLRPRPAAAESLARIDGKTSFPRADGRTLA